MELREAADAIVKKGNRNSLGQQIKDIMEEGIDLLRQFSRELEDIEALRHELSYLKDQCKDASLLEEQLTAASECDEVTNQRDSPELSVGRSEANCDAIRKVTEDQKVETQQLEANLNDLEDKNTEQGVLNLEGGNLVAKIKKADQFEEQLQSGELNGGMDVLNSRARWLGTYTEALELHTHGLEALLEDLVAQRNEIGALQKELNTMILECEHIGREIKGNMEEDRGAVGKEEGAQLSHAAAPEEQAEISSQGCDLLNPETL
jgi:methyl-accepting chemotaxis protein